VFRMGSTRNPIKVLMPVAQAEAAGLRRPMTKQEAEQALQAFQLPATPLEPHLREELDEVSARLSGHDPLMVAATIRDLVAAGVKGWLGQPDGAFTNHRRSEQAMLTQALGQLIEVGTRLCPAHIAQDHRGTYSEMSRADEAKTRRVGHQKLKVAIGVSRLLW